MISTGTGPALVLIPGIQGRWEWMAPTVRALAARMRVISYSLCGDRGSGCRLDRAAGFENYARQLDEVFERAGLDRAVLCGVSYGGFIAVHYAAHRGDRVSGLVLVSSPGPRWRPDLRAARHVRAPYLRTPLFIARAPFTVAREVAAALPRHRDRWAFRLRHLGHIVRAPFSPARMAERVRFALEIDVAADCAKVRAPTLVVTGEPRLDRIVPVESTREYLACIRGATGTVFERTGHLGLVTRPVRFAQIVGDFVDAHTGDAPEGHVVTDPRPKALLMAP